MRRAAWLLAAVGALAGAAPDGPVARRKVRAPDGAALALYRYQTDGGGASRPALLLVPDLGFGRESFDLDGEGLARFLQRHGRDAFVAELRGQGQADAPPAWALSEWATVDLPAAVAAVQQAHPGPVDLVVHGYGGALALAAAPRELKGKVRKVIALSPAVAPEVPNGAARRLLGTPGTLSRAGPEGQFALLFGMRGGMEKAGARDLGPGAAAELLRWMESGDLTFPDGSTLRGRLAEYDRPTLVVLPMLDNWAHAEFAEPLRALAPKAKVRLRSLSRLYLQREDYSHLSMLHGRSAPQEIFLPALGWLDEEVAP